MKIIIKFIQPLLTLISHLVNAQINRVFQISK